MIERWSASGLNARYAKTGSGIVSRLSTSTAPRYEGLPGRKDASRLDTFATNKRKA